MLSEILNIIERITVREFVDDLDAGYMFSLYCSDRVGVSRTDRKREV